MVQLNEVEVAQVLSQQPDLIREAVLEALEEQRTGSVWQKKTSLRINKHGPSSDRLTSMMGLVGNPVRILGFKLVGSSHKNRVMGLPRASTLIVLCDPETHSISHLIAGSTISLQRTAEIAVVGMQTLISQPSRVVVIGTGALAKIVAACVRRRFASLENIQFYGRAELNQLGPSESIAADVVITATTSDSPLLTQSNLQDAELVVNLGLREISAETLAGFDVHIVDDLDSCATQATPLAEALHSKLILRTNVHQLADVASTTIEIADDSRIYFQPSGMVAIDLITALKVLQCSQQSVS
jgi:ornithine cyclodeaminase/alanine dehydrogenase-like protein (mu-crystallin family)